MFTHSIYENVRVRVIIVHNGKMLLHALREGLGRRPLVGP
jgi:hypothetical protein